MKRRIATPFVIALTGLSLAAAPAVASGGSGGGGGGTGSSGGGGTVTTAPAPAPAVDVCDGYWNMPPYPDGSLPVVNRTTGGCVIVKHSVAGVNTLDQVVLVPGWTYVLTSNGAGTASRVQVDLSNPTTGQTASIRVENGKTVIR